MNKFINNLILAAFAIVVISCTEPTDPTPTNMSYGDWRVDEYYVNGQEEGSSIIDRFTLERDGTFLLEDNNGILTIGTWTATETALTLSGQGEGAASYNFTIVFQSYEKMHLLQNIQSPTAGTIEIRYLMNKTGDGSTY